MGRPVMDCDACGAEMRWIKAHYECPACHWIKPCCEIDRAWGGA